ncbi:LysM domain protein [Cordyceps fumosorosea ARSEF 2679]|uniref:LysM domain protein n=1 Tax=Cordyceps fumosorosea (strain ARSEF 2679) TaxID=1081104 RepID=A0A162MSP2_CORFA|nr:LysM domain protein [Cordyceps fumosorosea ARSEF 2679]OAA69679.1 LysM domain protein [Cordyceps fumosorosea ARSEF 2679]
MAGSRARAMVDEAIDQQGKYNLWRLVNPRRGVKGDPNTAQLRPILNSGLLRLNSRPELLKAVKLTNNAETQNL